jgi:hypothetical protein
MYVQALSHNKFIGKTLNLLLWLSALILTFYLTDLFLKANFSYNGEAYMKGAGHLLKEDFWKGLFFITTRQLFAATIIFYLLFWILPKEIRQIIFKILTPIWIIIIALTLLYAGIKIYDVIDWGYDRTDRIAEITLTWLIRATGFFWGYWLVVKGVEIKLNAIP